MKNHKATCRQIIQEMLQTVTKEDELQLAEHFADFINEYFPVADFNQSEHAIDDAGIALSSLHAAECVYDYLRTTRFVKGVHQVLTHLDQKFPDRKIKVIYAGTGPYATLVLPLMTLLDESRFELFLLDFHQESIDHCKHFGRALDLNVDEMHFIQADATTYSPPEGVLFDVLISETMFSGLTREPQVAIMAHLVHFLQEDGFFIPEAIELTLHYSLWGDEPHRNLKNLFLGEKQVQPSRKLIGPVMYFDKQLAKTFYHSGQNYSQSLTLLPDHVSPPDLIILTRVIIADQIILDTCDSTISNSICVGTSSRITSGQFQLQYLLSHSPEWKLEVMD